VLYGAAAYGPIASVAGLAPMIARATGPFAAAVYAASVGYGTLLWTLVALGALAAALGIARVQRAERASAKPRDCQCASRNRGRR
jgi:hypothetical protein